MHTNEISPSLSTLFSELVLGPKGRPASAFILNSGDIGLLASLDKLSAADASSSVHGGATIAAHVEHERYGLSLMNRWASEGGDPFADARWDDAWRISEVNESQWSEIRSGLKAEADRWLATLASPRDVRKIELSGMIASIAHLAYHFGAIRQIASSARGPKDGTLA